MFGQSLYFKIVFLLHLQILVCVVKDMMNKWGTIKNPTILGISGLFGLFREFFGFFRPVGTPKLKANFKRPLPPPSAATTLHTWRDGGDGLFAQVLLKKEPYLTHSVESNDFSPSIRFYVKVKNGFCELNFT